MRYPAESDIKLASLLDAAEKEPVFIERGEQQVAVVLSARDYDRLSGKAARAFNDFCDAVADRAAARGLTEEKLDELLKHA